MQNLMKAKEMQTYFPSTAKGYFVTLSTKHKIEKENGLGSIDFVQVTQMMQITQFVQKRQWATTLLSMLLTPFCGRV